VFVVEASTEISASAENVLAFVMDLDRYRQADHKIRRVRTLRCGGDEVVVSTWTRIRGLPVPAIQRLKLTAGERIDVTIEPSWRDRLADFHGEFVCTPTSEGAVRVTHRYTFNFKGLGRMAEPFLRDWMARDIKAEVGRIKSVLERSP